VVDEGNVFETLGARTLRDQIADRIREAIVSGSLSQGERLVERKLSAQFGASLSAVREALIELEAHGLVVRTRNSATHVVKLTPDAVEKIFKVRRALEGLVVEEASQNATPEQLGELREIHRSMERSAEAGESEWFDELLVGFHRKVWEMADNEYLLQALERTVLQYFEDSRMRRAADGGRNHDGPYYRRVLDSHGWILDAIESGDAGRARQAFDDAFQGWYANALEKHGQLRNAGPG
jgi:DNA-binding GntR family transcriptional regulator